MTTHFRQVPTDPALEDRFSDFGRDQLLAEVDLKWLFAGQGRWIDAKQLRGDPLYAAQVLKTAMDSPVEPLHSCAMVVGGLRAEHYL